MAATLEAEASDRATLLAVECEKSPGGTCSTQHLVALHFADGALASKEVVVTTSVDHVRFDLGENRLYRNRYVITEWGDVVDIERKEVLHEGLGQYVAAEGDRIVSRVNREDVEGTFAFDLGMTDG